MQPICAPAFLKRVHDVMFLLLNMYKHIAAFCQPFFARRNCFGIKQRPCLIVLILIRKCVESKSTKIVNNSIWLLTVKVQRIEFNEQKDELRTLHSHNKPKISYKFCRLFQLSFLGVASIHSFTRSEFQTVGGEACQRPFSAERMALAANTFVFVFVSNGHHCQHL